MKFQFAAFADEAGKDLVSQVAALKENGYSFLEIRNLDGINFTKMTTREMKEVSAVLADNGISVRSLGSPIGKMKIAEDFEAHMELCRHTLELGNILGAEQIRMFSFYMPKEEDPTPYRDLVIERVGRIAETARSFGIVPCHENEKGIYGDNASRCLELLKAVPQLRAVFDPANFVQCGQDTLEAWEMLAPYVEYMHIKDAIPGGAVVPPGQGAGNVGKIIAKYAAQGGRVLSLEPHLTKFVGLASLESEGDTSEVGVLNFASAREAFDYAVNNLNRIVEDI